MTSTNTPTSEQCCELSPGPWNMLAAMLPTANWSGDAEAGRVTRAVAARDTDVYDRLARALFRRERRHVLLTGDKGVGKTAVVRELARREAAGEIPFLADKQFLWIDASNVGPEDSRACLDTIAAVARTPAERRGVSDVAE